jgi:hypothetical protein
MQDFRTDPNSPNSPPIAHIIQTWHRWEHDRIDCADPRVVERGGRARLPLETSQALRVLRHVLRKHLDRHVSPELRVLRPVDLSHPARTERREDLVRPEPDAGREGQGAEILIRRFRLTRADSLR